MSSIRKRMFAGVLFLLLTAPSLAMAAQSCIRLNPVTLNGPSGVQYLAQGIYEMASAKLSEGGIAEVQDCPSHALTLTVTLFGGSVSISASLVTQGGSPIKVARSGPEGELFSQVAAVIEAIVATQSVEPRDLGTMGGDVVSTPSVEISPEKTETRTQPVNGRYKTIAMGDVTGDGQIEVVAASGGALLVYKVAKGILIESGQFEVDDYLRPNRVNVLDMDGDGVGEVIISGVHAGTGGAVSRIVSLKGGALEVLADDIQYFLDVVTPLGAEVPICIGQRLAGIELTAPLYNMTLSGEKVTRNSMGSTLEGLNVFGWDSAPASSGHKEGLFRLTDNGGLVYLKGGTEPLWQGDSGFGEVTGHVWIEEGNRRVEKRLYLLPRIRRVDTPTLKGVALTQNEVGLGGLFKGIKKYKKGRVSVASWNGYEVDITASTRSYEGFVPDFAIGDVDGDGKLESIFPVVSSKRTYFVLSQIER